MRLTLLATALFSLSAHTLVQAEQAGVAVAAHSPSSVSHEANALGTQSLLSAEQLQQAAAQQLAMEQQQQQLEMEREQRQRDDAIAAIIRDSGLLGLSDQIRNLAVATLNQQQAPLGHQYQLAGILAERFQPALWSGRLAQSLTKLETPSLLLMQQVLADERLQQGRAKEQQALADQQSDEFQQYVLRLRQQPPAAYRLQALSQLDQAMGFSTLLIASHEQVHEALAQVIKDWQPEENWQAQLQARVQEFLLYAYRTTPNGAIDEQASLYQQSDLQQWLSSVPAQM